MSKHMRVKWELDVEDTDDPIEAVYDCWRRLQDGENEWIWEVTDMNTGKIVEVDCEFQEDGNPLITEIESTTKNK